MRPPLPRFIAHTTALDVKHRRERILSVANTIDYRYPKLGAECVQDDET